MNSQADRISATYDIETPIGLSHAAAIIAGEQSTGTFVKLAAETDELRDRAAARVETVVKTGDSKEPALVCRHSSKSYERGLVTISWPPDNFGLSLPTLLSTLAGNLFELAELSAIRLVGVDLPAGFAMNHPGPQFGATGTRCFMGEHTGPLIGTIIKPSIGLTPSDTAALVKTLVEAGIDFIKDDELQANGPGCPFSQRLNAVMNVINAHAQKTGKQILYAVNVTDEIDQMKRNLDEMRSVGANCAMVCLHSIGLPGIRAVRENSSVPIHGHRAGWGLLSRSSNIGISFNVMQKLWRLAGADHLHVNGLSNKFSENDSVVAAAARSVQCPISAKGGPDHIAMPVYSSAQTIWQVDPSRRILGNDDFIICAGGGIMGHPGGIAEGVISMREAAVAARLNMSLEDYAKEATPLHTAMSMYPKPQISLAGLVN